MNDGLNCWPAVHRLDAAQLFRLALEKGTAGARYHGVAEEGVPFREIAGVIGRHLALPVVSMPEKHFGFFGGIVAADNQSSSTLTKEWLGWMPKHPSLIPDPDHGCYFE